MSYPKNIGEQIEKYINGSLSGNELHAFEAELSNNDALRKDVAKERVLQKVVMQHKLLDIKAIAQEEYIHSEKRNKSLKKGITLGAIVLLLVGGGLYWNNQNTDIADKTTPTTPLQEKEKETSPTTSIQDEKKVETKAQSKDISNTKGYNNKVDKEDSVTLVKPMKIELEPIQMNELLDKKAKSAEEKKILPTPCQGIEISFDLKTKATCPDKNEGQINLNNIQGGNAPYTTELFSIKGAPYDDYHTLPAGEYELIITDSEGCFEIKPIDVPKMACPIEDYFNPTLGEKWEAPIHTSSGELTIFNKAGTPEFSRTINAQESFIWDGYSNSGLLPAGYYIFVINYKDGKVLKGGITITE